MRTIHDLQKKFPKIAAFITDKEYYTTFSDVTQYIKDSFPLIPIFDDKGAPINFLSSEEHFKQFKEALLFIRSLKASIQTHEYHKNVIRPELKKYFDQNNIAVEDNVLLMQEHFSAIVNKKLKAFQDHYMNIT